MSQLKLVALDRQDLEIISAHVQDAVMKVRDLTYLAGEKRFVLAMNRFVWENRKQFLRRNDERRRAVLHFDRVLGVKASGVAKEKPDEVLSLLAIRFEPAEAPAGNVDLLFSGGAILRLEVECIEASLADIGGSWEAIGRPRHDN
ncbi:DUF2948 family protein [Aquamicrobium sp. LC103]|uniref:DUF2948 family protein n=1 Tax=Aquamicrobium sp. LC103 TaxID=1120658 RepID=UPI00063EA187|nr:DUF2948 family protein [Aquamicrobium sp. LC103]TKT74187.1 DUF2948 family protein [Aquamicrobium sp. LC103]